MRGCGIRLLLIVAVILSIIGPRSAAAVDSQSSGASAAAVFPDVPATHWAHEPIRIGVERGYIKGFPDGTFRPNDPVTAAQFVKMALLSLTDDSRGYVFWSEKYLSNVPPWHLIRLVENTANFEDGTPWYQNYVETAKNNGFIHNEFDGRFDERLPASKPPN